MQFVYVCVCGLCVCSMVPAGSHGAAGFHLGFICSSSREQTMQPSICASIQQKEVRYVSASVQNKNTSDLCRLSTHAQPFSSSGLKTQSNEIQNINTVMAFGHL